MCDLQKIIAIKSCVAVAKECQNYMAMWEAQNKGKIFEDHFEGLSDEFYDAFDNCKRFRLMKLLETFYVIYENNIKTESQLRG